MVPLTTVLQPLASVTVKLKGPADTLVCAPSPSYGDVPPEAVMFTVVVAPKQPMGSCVSLALSAGGWLMLPVTCVTQPLASVTVKSKGPAGTLVCTPSPSYGDVPPEAVMFTVVVPPKQPMGSCVSLALSVGGWLMVPLTTVLQPLASVTVKLNGPADTLACAPSPEYGGVPPEAVMFTVVVPPKQARGSCVSLASTAESCLMLEEA